MNVFELIFWRFFVSRIWEPGERERRCDVMIRDSISRHEGFHLNWCSVGNLGVRGSWECSVCTG